MRRTIPWILMAALFLVPVSSVAEIDANNSEFEILLGYYQPGADVVDGNATAGLRYGYNISQHLNIGGEFALFRSNDNIVDETSSATPVTADVQMYWLDVSVAGQFAVDNKAVPYILGGIGGGKMDVNRTSFGGIDRPLEAAREGSFTALVYALTVCVYNFAWNMTHPFLLGAMASFDQHGRVVVYAVAAQMLGLAVGPAFAASLLKDSNYAPIVTAGIALFVLSWLLMMVPLVLCTVAGNM